MSDAIKALCKAQKEMGAVVKNAKNPHLKKSYADLGSVMEACFDALHTNGFAVMQPGGQDEYGPFVETVFAHESGDVFRSKVYLVIGKNDMQGVGSAWTYARRYGLLGMAGLAPEDDDGEATKRPRNDENSRTADKPKPTEKTPEEKRDAMKAAIKKATGCDSLDEMWKSDRVRNGVSGLPQPMQNELQKAFTDRMAELS